MPVKVLLFTGIWLRLPQPLRGFAVTVLLVCAVPPLFRDEPFLFRICVRPSAVPTMESSVYTYSSNKLYNPASVRAYYLREPKRSALCGTDLQAAAPMFCGGACRLHGSLEINGAVAACGSPVLFALSFFPLHGFLWCKKTSPCLSLRAPLWRAAIRFIYALPGLRIAASLRSSR